MQQAVQLAESIIATAVGVLGDNSLKALPAGTACAFALQDPSVASLENGGIANPCRMTVTKTHQASNVLANVKLPGATGFLPFKPESDGPQVAGLPIVFGVPASAATQIVAYRILLSIV